MVLRIKLHDIANNLKQHKKRNIMERLMNLFLSNVSNSAKNYM